MIPGSGRSPGGGNGNPFQYPCLRSPKDRGAWWATVHGVAESDTTEGLSTALQHKPKWAEDYPQPPRRRPLFLCWEVIPALSMIPIDENRHQKPFKDHCGTHSFVAVTAHNRYTKISQRRQHLGHGQLGLPQPLQFLLPRSQGCHSYLSLSGSAFWPCPLPLPIPRERWDGSGWGLGGFPGRSDGKETACNVGHPGLIPELGRTPGEEMGNSLQCFCLENPMDRGVEWATAHGVEKSRTRLSN